MIPGPSHVLACVACGDLFKVRTLLSGNTLGAILWSDGLLDAPMLPSPPPITICAECGAFVWIEDAPRVGVVPGFRDADRDRPVPREWTEAPAPRSLDEGELLRALASGQALGDGARERTLRTLAWWRANDPWRTDEPRRDVAQRPWTRSAACVANLRGLIATLADDQPEDRLRHAEILRELGEHDAAMDLLDPPWDEHEAWVAGCIADLARAEDPVVRPIPPVPTLPYRFTPDPDNRPCPYCGEPLRTNEALQCFECGMDWHDPDHVVRRGGP